MIDIPEDAVDAMKAEILKQMELYNYVEVSELAYATLDPPWLFAHFLSSAVREGGEKRYVIYWQDNRKRKAVR